MAIVLPEGVFGNPTDQYIFEYIFENAKILGIVSCPPETFQPSTHTKTSILFLEKIKNKQEDYNFFMSIAEKAGHDKNGKIIYKMGRSGNFILNQNEHKIIDDDLPIITERFMEFKRNGDKLKEYSHLGFSFKYSKIKNYILIPDYYNPDIENGLKALENTGKYQLVNIQSLIDQKILTIKRGNEIGSRFYGTGDEEVYEIYKSKQDVREYDLLFVNDGTFLIGRSAMVTKLDKRIIIQSHIRKIRVKENNLLDPYLLFYLLNTYIVKKQVEEKTFVQATISTLGNRLSEIILPIPKNVKEKKQISSEMEEIIEGKMRLREKSIEIISI
jgi:type I restriction enzyme M protein